MSGLAASNPDQAHTESVVVYQQAVPTGGGLPNALTGMLGPLIAFFAIFAVHRLTRGRERERLVFDFYKLATENLVALKSAGVSGWTLEPGVGRQVAVAETKWRLQQLGGTVERLRLMSSMTRWALSWPLRQRVEVSATQAMKVLRDALTNDPFEDPDDTRTSDAATDVEFAIGEFQTSLDSAIHGWMH